MKSLDNYLAVWLAFASFPLYASATCTKNACYKKVAANGQSPEQCSKFFQKTVTPATVTVHTTQTVTRVKTDTTTTTLVKRAAAGPITNSETAVPKYAATACPKPASYSSACSCVVDPKHVTLHSPTPTTTVTVTHVVNHSTSATATHYPTSCPTAEPFNLRVTSGPAFALGQYVINSASESPDFNTLSFGPLSAAAMFTRSSNCTLISENNGNRYLYIGEGDPSELIVDYSASVETYSQLVPCGLGVSDGDDFFCSTPDGRNEFFTNCSNDQNLWLALEYDGNYIGCSPITLAYDILGD